MGEKGSHPNWNKRRNNSTLAKQPNASNVNIPTEATTNILPLEMDTYHAKIENKPWSSYGNRI